MDIGESSFQQAVKGFLLKKRQLERPHSGAGSVDKGLMGGAHPFPNRSVQQNYSPDAASVATRQIVRRDSVQMLPNQVDDHLR
jgi:hypothetical protein